MHLNLRLKHIGKKKPIFVNFKGNKIREIPIKSEQMRRD